MEPPRTRDIALVALASCIDLTGRIVRSGMRTLTRGSTPEQAVRTLARLRLLMVGTSVALLGLLGLGLVAAATVSPWAGAVLAVTAAALPATAAVQVTRTARTTDAAAR